MCQAVSPKTWAANTTSYGALALGLPKGQGSRSARFKKVAFPKHPQGPSNGRVNEPVGAIGGGVFRPSKMTPLDLRGSGFLGAGRKAAPF